MFILCSEQNEFADWVSVVDTNTPSINPLNDTSITSVLEKFAENQSSDKNSPHFIARQLFRAHKFSPEVCRTGPLYCCVVRLCMWVFISIREIVAMGRGRIKYLLCKPPSQESAELDWLVTEKNRHHSLLPRSISDLSLPTRLRGTPDWAPPRAQIIYHMHLPATRKVPICDKCNESFEEFQLTYV